jgi:hypothetical protein
MRSVEGIPAVHGGEEVKASLLLLDISAARQLGSSASRYLDISALFPLHDDGGWGKSVSARHSDPPDLLQIDL